MALFSSVNIEDTPFCVGSFLGYMCAQNAKDDVSWQKNTTMLEKRGRQPLVYSQNTTSAIGEAVQFRKLFDFSATHVRGCLKMQGWRAKLQPCGENSVFTASIW